jgi:hypothetical protein
VIAAEKTMPSGLGLIDGCGEDRDGSGRVSWQTASKNKGGSSGVGILATYGCVDDRRRCRLSRSRSCGLGNDGLGNGQQLEFHSLLISRFLLLPSKQNGAAGHVVMAATGCEPYPAAASRLGGAGYGWAA